MLLCQFVTVPLLNLMIQTLQKVTSLDIPELEPYKTLKRPTAHRKLGIFIVEGSRVVRLFLQSKLQAISVLVTEERIDQYRESIQTREEPIQVFVTPQQILEQIVGFDYHQGIMALGKVPQFPSIDRIVKLDSQPALFVALDGITNAENVGVVARNCAACGVKVLIAGETSADPYLRRSVRNSMGTIFNLQIVYSDNLQDTLHDLRYTYNFETLAAHPRPDSVPIYHVDFRKNCCIVLGHEGNGVSANVLQECSIAATIPMEPGVDSFNVACASAIFLYEANRQRML